MAARHTATYPWTRAAMTSLDLDGWNAAVYSAIEYETQKRQALLTRMVDAEIVKEAQPFDLDRECKAALERIHRSAGQRARWAKHEIAKRVARDRYWMSPAGAIQRQKNDILRNMMNDLTLLKPATAFLAPTNKGGTVTFRRWLPYGVTK